jgi:eukaryotic-like serine/threonine-protein kinase
MIRRLTNDQLEGIKRRILNAIKLMNHQISDQGEAALPRRIGKYKIRGFIGQGALGIVYRGYDADIDRLVAIKMIHPHLRDEAISLRFKHEARAAARCVHRNIVMVFDFGMHDDSPYMVMEYVEGIDLRSFLKSNRTLSVRESCDIILYVLQALEYAHKNGVVHRDIKPGNILLLDDGMVKVADFGVARIETSVLTNVGDVIGTPLYMSPEARNGSLVDNRADLFTVGVVLLELICGARPKRHLRSPDDAVRLLMQSPLGDDERADFRRLFKKALAVMPEERFQTAREFSNELKSIISPNQIYKPDLETLAATILTTMAGKVAPKNQSRPPPSQLTLTLEASKQLSSILSTYLGPVATYLIKSASTKSRDFDELVGKLAKRIPSQGERLQFVKKLEHTSLRTFYRGSGTPGTGLGPTPNDQAVENPSRPREFSQEQLRQVTKDLIVFLGPVAPNLVRRTAKRARDLRQLYLLLSEHINSAKDRRQFLKGK